VRAMTIKQAVTSRPILTGVFTAMKTICNPPEVTHFWRVVSGGLRQHFEQVVQFRLHIRAGADGLGDLGFHQFAEAFA
jgi:hypothetical protein